MNFLKIYKFASMAAMAIALIMTTSVFGVQKHKFPTPELDAFHTVLHPLVHEALPKKDARRIRKNVAELNELGEKIIKSSLPKEISLEQEKNLKEQIDFFGAALNELVKISKKKGKDSELMKGLDSVHEEFEELVEAYSSSLKK